MTPQQVEKIRAIDAVNRFVENQPQGQAGTLIIGFPEGDNSEFLDVFHRFLSKPASRIITIGVIDWEWSISSHYGRNDITEDLQYISSLFNERIMEFRNTPPDTDSSTDNED